ncbi:Dynamin family protein [Cordyceps fumosorosea ARSEF 2679]|uniref:Dynamin family protein n=1 Tax=Cordyceps fumosorosea (strain ARSEF 2679) TaxID=1081104 RepID=A0A162MSL6_CORFA|nr:Dynamin family protein [Cordyceps fumosorosea ARSEF 2679]OAA69659.1 Dynamin family protein [Cordyceps fumosorosea ARSEF 2679]
MSSTTTTTSRRRVNGIKRERESLNSLPSDNEVTSETNQISLYGSGSGHSLDDAATDTPGMAPPLSYRHGRSDAPTPSDRADDAEPLLREMRVVPMMPPPGLNPQEEGSFFQESFRDIAKRLKAFNDALGELQQLGVSHDVQLPELVLVGDQSAGKSSLMSGLAQLDLPRSEGTCTRCPLHIRVSMNPEWSCRVWLRKQYTYAPPTDRNIMESDVTDADPFFPWKQQPTTDIIEFKTMHENTEIEEVLRWAQIAILNDNKNPALYVPGSGSIASNTPISLEADRTLAKFSPNIVALEIKGPDLPNLSFYDMPGIFQNPADARDDYLVSVVTNLSKAYIQHPSAIIMCSMPMNSDAENSCTFGLTRKLGASARTIGVLTKADLLSSGGSYDQWLSIMKGEAHKTGLGYFITSRPQGKTLEELSKWEEAMFVEHGVEAWPSDFHQFSSRCGVERLKTFLSEKLADAFASSLPTIKRKVANHLEVVKKKLGALPELPDNIELEVESCLMEFSESCRQGIDELIKFGSILPKDFRDCLLHIKPKFTLKDRSDTPVVEISDDDSDAAPLPTATPSKRRQGVGQITPSSKRVRLENSNNVPNGHVSNLKREETASPSSSISAAAPRAKKFRPPPPFTEYSALGSGFRTLAQVKKDIQGKMQAGTPDVIPPDVYQDMAVESIKVWEQPTHTFLRATMGQLHEKLREKLDLSLHRLRKRLIYRETAEHLLQFLKEQLQKTQEMADLVLKHETRQLITFQDDTFKLYKEMEEKELKWFRHRMRCQARFPEMPVRPGNWATMNDEQRLQETREQEKETVKLGPDAFADEVMVVSYVRGYYRLAALRFVDRMSQLTLCGMLPDIRMRLDFELRSRLDLQGGNAAAAYQRLMDEDTATAAKREALKSEREKFVRALETIQALEGNPGLDESIYDASTASVSFLARDRDILMEDSQTTSEIASGEA